MTTRAKAKLNDLLDLPGMTEMPGFHLRRTLNKRPSESADRSSSVLLDEPRKTPKRGISPKSANNNNRRVLRLSPESRDILKLLKKNLRLTYDQQIQFLGQLVLYHELLPEKIGLLIQERVRELRRFSNEDSTNISNPQEDLRLSKPLPLDNLLATLEERCAHLQRQVESLTKAIDAKTELQLLSLELANTDDPHENQLPALA